MITLLFVLFFIFLIIGLPVGFCLIISSMVYIFINPEIGSQIITQRIVGSINSFPLLAVPAFMLAAAIMNIGLVTNRIFSFCNNLVGHWKGGLGYVNVLASAIFAGMSGSSLADAGGLGSIEIEMMKEKGYDINFSVAITAASSMIGPIFPPSIPLVIFGVYANVSVGALFIGGIIPGILMGIFIMLGIYVVSKKKEFPISKEKAPFSSLIKSFYRAIPALFIPAIILGGIFTGIFTPTEAATVAVIYALLLGVFIYQIIDTKKLIDILKETSLNVASVMLIIAGATLFSWIIAFENIPIMLSDFLLSLTENYWILLFLINIILLVAGCFLEPAANIIIFAPVLMPIIHKIGMNPVQFGIIMVLNLTIGMLTPPVGIVALIVCKIAKIKPIDGFKAILLFLPPLLFVLFLINVFPKLVLMFVK